MKERFNQLSKREKKITVASGVLIMVVIIYFGLYSPLVSHVHALRNQIQQDQTVLAFMQQADQTINQVNVGRHKNKPESTMMLLSILQKQINEASLNLALIQLKQGTGETVAMRFQKVEFDKLMRLLLMVTKQQAVTIEQLSAKTNRDLGLVDAEVVLKMDDGFNKK